MLYFDNIISIPLWYDYKLSCCRCLHLQTIFQFHCDTIISFPWWRYVLRSRISIPLWYDYKSHNLERIPERYPISIPLWYDYKCRCPMRCYTLKYISIPLWYDYKQITPRWFLTVLIFQFHCDTIISVRVGKNRLFKYHFNSTVIRL